MPIIPGFLAALAANSGVQTSAVGSAEQLTPLGKEAPADCRQLQVVVNPVVISCCFCASICWRKVSIPEAHVFSWSAVQKSSTHP